MTIHCTVLDVLWSNNSQPITLWSSCDACFDFTNVSANNFNNILHALYYYNNNNNNVICTNCNNIYYYVYRYLPIMYMAIYYTIYTAGHVDTVIKLKSLLHSARRVVRIL